MDLVGYKVPFIWFHTAPQIHTQNLFAKLNSVA